MHLSHLKRNVLIIVQPGFTFTIIHPHPTASQTQTLTEFNYNLRIKNVVTSTENQPGHHAKHRTPLIDDCLHFCIL